MYDVVDWEEDLAGKFRYRVLVAGRIAMFKFETPPTDEEVQATAAQYDAMMQEQADGAPNPE